MCPACRPLQVNGAVTSGPDLSVTVNGLHFPNPFVIGSGEAEEDKDSGAGLQRLAQRRRAAAKTHPINGALSPGTAGAESCNGPAVRPGFRFLHVVQARLPPHTLAAPSRPPPLQARLGPTMP